VHGNKKEAFRELLSNHTSDFVEESLASRAGPLALFVPRERLERIKAAVTSVMVEDFEKIMPLGYNYTKQALDIENTLREALFSLPSRDFERVLHPVFEEDEVKLILVGGVLGCLAGLFQGLVLFQV